jgi:hypothetical protein
MTGATTEYSFSRGLRGGGSKRGGMGKGVSGTEEGLLLEDTSSSSVAVRLSLQAIGGGVAR